MLHASGWCVPIQVASVATAGRLASLSSSCRCESMPFVFPKDPPSGSDDEDYWLVPYSADDDDAPDIAEEDLPEFDDVVRPLWEAQDKWLRERKEVWRRARELQQHPRRPEVPNFAPRKVFKAAEGTTAGGDEGGAGGTAGGGTEGGAQAELDKSLGGLGGNGKASGKGTGSGGSGAEMGGKGGKGVAEAQGQTSEAGNKLVGGNAADKSDADESEGNPRAAATEQPDKNPSGNGAEAAEGE
eukprot:1486420-Alexandrium_andersonii.AAC.1